MPIIETERLVMRPLTRADASALFPTFADPDQMRYWSRGPFESVDELADWLCDPDWDGRSWAVLAKGEDAAIGRLAVIPRGPEQSEIAYAIARDRQRQGIAAEALRGLLGYLFSVEGHRRIQADTDPDNVPSNRLVERLGFTMERRLKGSWRTHIGVRDSFIWVLEADNWQS